MEAPYGAKPPVRGTEDPKIGTENGPSCSVSSSIRPRDQGSARILNEKYKFLGPFHSVILAYPSIGSKVTLCCVRVLFLALFPFDDHGILTTVHNHAMHRDWYFSP